ncbi:hypothetical protein IFM89_003579, partial [Coptis chinensis]
VMGDAANALVFNNRLTALVVDDCKLTRMVYMHNLVNLGVEVKEVKNGKQAVDLFQSGEVFDLVLMDLEMPIMNGAQATKMLREMGVGTKIIGVTAHSKGPEQDAFMEAGLDECHEKPLTLENLINILRDIDENL